MIKISTRHQATHFQPPDSRDISVCIIIPTYNESENIKKLLGIIFSDESCREYERNNVHMEVLVVDDNSPDGTASVVMEMQSANPRIHLLVRGEKNGLGAAYISGIQHALSSIKPDVLFEMDADLSHDPSYIMPMISEIREGADFVVGSRYTLGGSVPAEWGIRRKLISKGANTYARLLLNIHDVKDCTGGFRAIRVSILERIDLNLLNSRGYVFQISLLEAALRSNALVREVPIAFNDRTIGNSKMQLKDIFEVGIVVLRLGLQRLFYSPADNISIQETDYSNERAKRAL